MCGNDALRRTKSLTALPKLASAISKSGFLLIAFMYKLRLLDEDCFRAREGTRDSLDSLFHAPLILQQRPQIGQKMWMIGINP